MSVIISHNSALEYLRSIPPQIRGDNTVHRAIETPRGLARGELFSFGSRSFGLRQQPIHLLTSRDSTQVRSKGVVPHQTSLEEIPPGLLLEVEDGVYVCGPELVFIQLLSSITDLGAIVLGYELCGTYSHFAPLVSGFYDRPQLTTGQRILSATDLVRGTRNVKRARRLLPLILDGSASPMETVTSNILFLPEQLGGNSLVMPILNCEVELDDVARKIAGTRTCVIDGAWKELHKGFEYNGSDHTDPMKDRNRLEALAHMGYSIYTIDAARMMYYPELRKVVDLICSDVPLRRGYSRPTDDEMRRLHRRLLAATRCGLGLDAALFGLPVHGIMGIRIHI